MTRIQQLLIATSLCLLPGIAAGQALDPALMNKPLGSTDAWPTYSGDYTGKRYSTLKQINQSNVKNLTLAWLSHLTAGAGAAGGGFGRGGGGVPTLSLIHISEPTRQAEISYAVF